MYQQPFGSIFGDTPLKKAEEETPAPAPAPQTEEERNKLLEARKAVQYEELLKPKVPFSREEPQFRAASTVVSSDPEVLLSQSKLSLDKSQIKYATLIHERQSLKNKISAAEVYIAVIEELKGLPQSKQHEIQKFISKNEKKLKALANQQKASEASQKIKDATAALDVEIRHWEELAAKKGKVKLKSFRPTKRIVSEELPTVKLLPKIGGKAESVVRLDKAGIAKFQGYGEEEVIPDQIISAKPKSEEYYVKYMQELPSQSFFVQGRRMDFEKGRIAQKTEQNVLLAQQYEWKSADLQKEVDSLNAKLATLRKDASIRADALDEQLLAGLGVAVNALPDSFRTGMILDNLRSAVTKASGLGDADPAVMQEEVKTREAVLTDLQAQTISAPTKPTKSWPLLLAMLAVVVVLLRRK